MQLDTAIDIVVICSCESTIAEPAKEKDKHNIHMISGLAEVPCIPCYCILHFGYCTSPRIELPFFCHLFSLHLALKLEISTGQ